MRAYMDICGVTKPSPIKKNEVMADSYDSKCVECGTGADYSDIFKCDTCKQHLCITCGSCGLHDHRCDRCNRSHCTPCRLDHICQKPAAKPKTVARAE